MIYNGWSIYIPAIVLGFYSKARMGDSLAYMYAETIVAITHKEVDKVFCYEIPALLIASVAVGSRVLVPFGGGNKPTEGYVIGLLDKIDFPSEKIKRIIRLLDDKPVFDSEMFSLAIWMKDKYYATMAECLKCMIPAGVMYRDDASISKQVATVSINHENEDVHQLIEKINTSPRNLKQRQVISLLSQHDHVLLTDLKAMLGITDSPVLTLLKNGVIKIDYEEHLRETITEQCGTSSPPALTKQQIAAIDFINAKTDNKPILIHGITGSGKTEIYMSLIQAAIEIGKQAIMLVPEISLTPQTVNIFNARFGKKVTVTHSRLSIGERYDQWKKARDGSVSIMIGPRSAIFAPFKNLGIIIIDEEHENTYKSETTPKYSAKEIAFERSEQSGAKVVLGSATPSLETYYMTQTGKIDLITLTERINKKLPTIHIVDMRIELDMGNKSIFSMQLYEAMSANLRKGEQTILFLNRRGHSTFVSCRKCGYVMKCENCSVNYTYHAANERLICHYCGDKIKNPENCPICGSKYIKYFGVGTQKVEDEVKKAFPKAIVLRMDMDTTTGKLGHEKILSKFRSGEAHILIGTQMIAKGLDFPNVSLVGIIAADLSLNNGDYRAGEITYQLLTQVSGRAGRAELEGSVYIQTYNPEHYSIVYARENNYIEFYNHEIVLRRQLMYPPFTKIFSILFTSEDERQLIIKIFRLLDIMKYYNRKGWFEMLGPAPAVVSKIRKMYRWKLLVKSEEEEKLKKFVLFCMDKLRGDSDLNNINVQLTLNPLLMV